MRFRWDPATAGEIFCRGLTARYPPATLPIGVDAMSMYAIAAMLPDWVLDPILSSFRPSIKPE